MKKLTALCIPLLLTGCFLGDHVPEIYPARIVTVNDHVCILVPAVKGEYLAYLDIEGTGSDKPLRKYVDENSEPVYILPNECVPLYGYKFESGRAYGVSVSLQTKEKETKGKPWRAFSSSFSLWRDENNKLQAGSTY